MYEKILNPKKVEQVGILTEKIKKSKAIILVDYKGMGGSEETKLRKLMRDSKVEYLVAKNRLFKIALKDAGVEAVFDDVLEGTTSFVLGFEDPVTPAKLAYEYSKGKKFFTIKAGVLEGKRLDVKGVETLATLPSKEVLISKMLGSMQAPISGFVRVLNGTLASLVYTLEAIKNKKAE